MPTCRLRRDSDTPFRIAAESGELAALARFLRVDRIDRLSFAGFVSPAPDDGWRVRGRLVAKIEQSCVVTLAPVRTRHEAEVERLYLPAERFGPEREVQVYATDDDPPDPYTDGIDLGELAVETLALMIDPYPRAGGAEFGQMSYAPSDAAAEGDVLPFAGLAALRTSRGTDRG